MPFRLIRTSSKSIKNRHVLNVVLWRFPESTTLIKDRLAFNYNFMEFVSFYANIHAKKLKTQLYYIKLSFSTEKFNIKESALIVPDSSIPLSFY